MSLEAVVYKNPEQIKQLFPNLDLCVDIETGESYLSDNVQEADRPKNDFSVSKQQWLGNLNSISIIRSELSESGIKSPIIERIISSGSQSGEYIEVSEFPQLKTEIESFQKLKFDASIVEFLKNISDLIKIGEAENNPIVFV